MKARIPPTNQQKKVLQQQAKIVIQEEMEKQRDEFSRKLFKLMCYVLNEKHNFGNQRLSNLIIEIAELIKEADTDVIFWEHIDRHVIDRLGIKFERDYTGKF